MILVSVIIPNYNHAPFLEKRITSVLAQTHPAAEIILLDDASTDHSRQIIEQYRSHPLVSHIQYNESNSGSPFKQWEKGIQLAKHDWVWIAESDDACSPDFLEKATQQLELHPGSGLFYCDARIVDDQSGLSRLFSAEKNRYFNTTKWSTAYVSPGRKEIEDNLGIRCTINNASSSLMKRELLLPYLTEIASYNFHGDWFSYLAIARKNGLILYDPGPMNTYQVNSSGVTNRLPVDGKHRIECFRILSFLYSGKDGVTDQNMVKQFITLNLSTGFISGFNDWKGYFRINRMLAMKVLVTVIKNRLTFNKKGRS